MSQTFNLSRILARRLQFNFPVYSWVIPNIKIHIDNVNNNDSSLIPSSSPGSKDKDILLDNIKKANSSKELLSIIAAHGQLFNQKHVIESLSCLHEFNKSREFDSTMQNMVNDPVFEKLCTQLRKYSRVLELSEIIEALKVLALLNVPINSTIFQMLLQLIRSNINNLELDQVVFLDYILKKCEHNHLIDAIQLALPLVFQLNVSSKMDKENIFELAKLLQYACSNNVPQNCVTSIVTSLVIHTSNIDQTSAKRILFSLTEHRLKMFKYNIAYEKLLKKCFNLLTDNINAFSLLEFTKILERLKEMIIFQHYHYYDSKFLDACGNYVIDQNLPFVSAMHVVRMFTRIAHAHLPLLEYVSQKFVLQSESIDETRPKNLISYINALSNANHMPEHFDEIKSNIINNPIFLSTRVELPWSKFALDLAVLGIYIEDTLKMIFSKDFLKDFLSRRNSFLDHLQLLTLYQAVKTFQPSIDLVFPSEIYLKAAGINCNREVNEVMKSTLTKSLGGPQYLGSQVQMPLGVFADFVVALRDGVYPVAINPECKEGLIQFKELDIPSRCDVLCILNYHNGCYSINNKRLRGSFEIINSVLETTGYKVLPLSINDWLDMPDVEKTLYLMREIKYKCAKDNTSDVQNNIT